VGEPKLIDTIINEDIEKIKQNLRTDFDGMSILVTGGAGFIGSWLCDLLLALDSEVACLDNLSTSTTRNTDHLIGKSRFKFVNADVCSFKARTKFDCIFHMASHASPEEYQKNPIETLRANSVGSINIAELARENDARVLFASTSEIYGDAKVIPTPETYWGNVNPVGPRSCYDEGKRFSEALFTAYHRHYGLDVRIARIFNTFGPRLREDGSYGRAVSRFIKQALAEEPITVYGDGKQTRSFCYIADTVEGLMLLALNKKANGEVVNIGNPEEITILQLAQIVKELTKSSAPLTFHPLPIDDPKRRSPRITKARALLKWRPRTNLEEGLRKTILWFQEKER
jgi:UDP-glucuronate decarboxylase